MVCTKTFAHDKGYCVVPNEKVTAEMVRIAFTILPSPMGTCTPFLIKDKKYEGCVEWHWDPVHGKHKGVTVYRECK